MPERDGDVRLRTLGALVLSGAALTRPKPLLLLAYLALEGRGSRRHLAELFFGGARHPLQSLSIALSRARRAVGPRVTSDERTVEVDLRVDTADLLEAVEGGDLERAGALYAGPFLEGFEVDGVGVEVEEWIYATREFLAEQLREARLRRAEWEAAAGRFDAAGSWAGAAWATPGATVSDPAQIARLHDVLLAADARVMAARVASEGRSWGLDLGGDTATARGRFGSASSVGTASLPVSRSEFVGRAAERSALRAALVASDTRLVTLVGPGGIGKTRLALEVAHEFAAAPVFRGGVHFVALEEVADDASVARRVADALRIPVAGEEDPTTRLLRALGERRALVVLDNAEHVSSGVADLLAAASATEVRWLVTSRERLLLRDETLVALEGLGVPTEGTHAPTALLESEAVTLFVQRARRARHTITHASLPDVARVCRAVGGWPLALEIGASLLRVMTLDELADELETRLDVLVDPARDVPDRHHSMLAVLDSTWRRLAPADRETAIRLSTFRGGFARADAEAVAGVGVATLARLVDRALVRPLAGGRYDLHPLVWRYARDRLDEHPDRGAIVRAHSRHYLARLAARTDDLGGVERDVVAERLGADHANLRDAWSCAVGAGDDAWWSAAAQGCGRYLDVSNRYREGVEWLGTAHVRARRIALDDDVHAALALAEGTMLARLARFDDAARAIAPATIAHEIGLRAEAHETLAHAIELWRGRYAAAGRHLREAEALYAELDDVAGGARCTFVLANIAWIAGDWNEASALLRVAREAFRGLADRAGEVVTIAGMGVVEMDRGRLATARELLELARRRAADRTTQHLRATVEVNLAHVRLLEGDVAGLEEELARHLAEFEALGDDPWVAETAAYAARVAAATGRASAAHDYLRTGLGAALRVAHLPSVADMLLAAGIVVAAAAPEDARTLLELVRDHPLAYANTRQESAQALARLGHGQPGRPVAGATDALVHPGAHAPVRTATSTPPVGGDPLAATGALLHDGLLPSGRSLALAASPPTAA